MLIQKLRSFRLLYLHWLESQNKLKMLKIARRSFLRISFSFHCRRAPNTISQAQLLALLKLLSLSTTFLSFLSSDILLGTHLGFYSHARTTTDTTRNQFTILYFFITCFIFIHHPFQAAIFSGLGCSFMNSFLTFFV